MERECPGNSINQPVDVQINSGDDSFARLINPLDIREDHEYFQILECSPIAHLMINVSDRIADVNTQAARLFAIEKNSLLGQKIDKYISPLHANKFCESLAAARQHRPVASFETEILTSHGVSMFALTDVSPLATIRGNLIVTLQDITGNKQVHHALVESEKQAADIVQQAPIGICEIDFDRHRFINVNNALCRIFEFQREEMLAMNPTDISDINGKPLFNVRPHLLPESGINNENIECKVRKKNGELIDILLTSNQINRDLSEKIILFVVHDITEQKKLGRAVKTSEDRFIKVFHKNPLPLLITDINRHTITDANDACSRLFESERQDLLGKEISEIADFRDKKEIEKFSRELLHNSVSPHCETSIRTKAGKPQHLLISHNLIEFNGKLQLIWNFENITVRKTLELMVSREKEKLTRILGTLSEGVCVINSDFSIGYANDPLVSRFGEIGNKKCYQYFRGFQKVCPGCNLSQIIEGKGFHDDVLISETNSYFEVTSLPIENEEGVTSKLSVLHDITERKKNEEALAHSEQNLRYSLDHSPLGIIILEIDDLSTVYANKAMLDIFGYLSFDDFNLIPPKERYDPQSYKDFQESYTKLKAGGETYAEFDATIMRKDGTTRNVHVLRNRVLWNRAWHYQVIYQDVTRQKLAEQDAATQLSLQLGISNILAAVTTSSESELYRICLNILKQITRSETGFFYEFTKSGKLKLLARSSEANAPGKGATAETGKKPESLSFYTSEILKHDKVFYRNTLIPREITKPSKLIMNNFLGVPLIHKGKIIGILGVFKNQAYNVKDADAATGMAPAILEALERRKAEAKIDYQAHLLEVTNDAIYATDANDKIVYWNPAAEEMYGWLSGEVLGKTPSQVIKSEKPAIAPKTPKLRNHDVSIPIEMVVKRKDGSSFWVESVSKAYFDGFGKLVGYVVANHDITERKQTEKIKDEFIGMISHELKSPLTVLIGSLHVATDKNLPAADLPDILQSAISSSEELADIINNLLELSRAQMQRLRLDFEPFAISELTTKIVNSLGAKSKIHSITVDIQDNLPKLNADRLRIERVLTNLVDNAIKYSPNGGEIILSVRKQGNEILFGITDHGIGISKQTQEHLFEPFYRGQHPYPAIPGIGLGLSVCKRLVEAHNGRIWVESKLKEGSTFFVALPLKETPNNF